MMATCTSRRSPQNHPPRCWRPTVRMAGPCATAMNAFVWPSPAAKGNHRVPVFNGSWSGSWVGEVWEGVWTDSLRPNNYQVPVRLEPLENAQPTSGTRDTTYWDTSEGLLVLERSQDSAWATISTPTGDYRHLAGTFVDNQLILNTFDGSHLFRFDATLRNDSLVDGQFLSGTHYRTTFDGVKRATQSHAWTSGRQNVVVDELLFFGTNPSGQAEVWNKDRLRRDGKTGLVVDIMGTWCPNCMDEARLMVSLAKSFPNVQFLTLGYERTTDSTALVAAVAIQTRNGHGLACALGWSRQQNGSSPVHSSARQHPQLSHHGVLAVGRPACGSQRVQRTCDRGGVRPGNRVLPVPDGTAQRSLGKSLTWSTTIRASRLANSHAVWKTNLPISAILGYMILWASSPGLW